MASVFHRLFQPADALVRVPHLPIVREEQFAKGVLCFRQPLFRRLGEPVLCLAVVRDQQRAVPIELPHPVLSVGVAAFRHLLQLLCRPVTVVQRNVLVPNDTPQFPAGIGFIPHMFRLVVLSQVIILEGDFPQPDALRLLYDSVFDLPELFLLGQLFPFSGFVVVVTLHLALELAPPTVALTHYRQLLQLVHHLIHGFLHGLGKVAVGFFALDHFQLSSQLLHLLLNLRSRADTLRHLLSELPDRAAGLLNQFIPRL